MYKLEYREIIKANLEQAVSKKDKATNQNEQNYWSKIIAELIADLRDLETGGQQRWAREPEDGAAQKYGRVTRINLDDLFRQFFGGFP